jgi:hypothetical protein
VVVALGKMIAPPCCPTECTFAVPPHPARSRPVAAVMIRALVFILVPLYGTAPHFVTERAAQVSFRNTGPDERSFPFALPVRRIPVDPERDRVCAAVTPGSGHLLDVAVVDAGR